MTLVQPAASTQTPQAPPPSGGAIRIEAGPGSPAQTITLPRTRSEVDELRARRSELSNQLTSASGRREELAGELASLPEGQARAGIEQRLAVLDQRIVQLETDIAETGRELTAANTGLLAESREGMIGGMPPGGVVAIGVLFVLLVMAPIAFAAARGMWKRSSRIPPALGSDATLRLERMEQAVDAIAIEIERISEGQRFVTRLLSEPGLGSGASNPARLTEAVPVRGHDSTARTPPGA